MRVGRRIDCGKRGAEPYDLPVPSTGHEGAPLRETCHGAVRRGMAEGA